MRASWVVSVATAFVVLGASILLFLNPVWVGFEQDRADVAAWTHACPAAYQPVTNGILGALVFGRDDEAATSAASCGGTPIDLGLSAAERGHMRDVRGVFQALYILVLVGAVALVVTYRRPRDPQRRAAWLRSVRRGAAGLAVLVAILGAISLVAFDAAFEVFHRLFFAAGTYEFDPRTSHLVQLFPDQFWSETTLALGAIVILACVTVAWLATRGLARAHEAGATAPAPALRVGKVAR